MTRKVKTASTTVGVLLLIAAVEVFLRTER